MLRTKSILCLGTLAAVLLLAASAHAADASAAIDSADTAWLLTSSALVSDDDAARPRALLRRDGAAQERALDADAELHPGRARLGPMGAVRLQPGVLARQRAYRRAFVGRTRTASARRSRIAAYSATVPHQAYMIYQCMFAVITPALITGAIAERMSFKGFLVFSLLWVTLIYDPLAHWVWGVDGWIHRYRRARFCRRHRRAYFVGHRRASRRADGRSATRLYRREPMPPHNLTMTRHRRGTAVGRMVRLQRRQRARRQRPRGFGLRRDASRRCRRRRSTWVAAEWWIGGKPTVLGAPSGAVAGTGRDNAGVGLRRARCPRYSSAESPACFAFSRCG